MGQTEIYKYLVEHKNEWIKIDILKEKFGKSAPFCCKKMLDCNEISRRRQTNVKGSNPPYEYMYDENRNL